MRNWKPIFIENSSIPKILSYVAPIKIEAITLGFIVCSRGEITAKTRQHETIHFQQFLETGFAGFFLLYAYAYVKNYIRFSWHNYKTPKNSPGYYRSVGYTAYHSIRAEKEAYMHDETKDYLQTRNRWEWLRWK